MFINRPFILASKSKSRKFILESNNLNFKQRKPKCDESSHKKRLLRIKKTPLEISLELSKIKATSISKKIKNKLVVASDTTINFKIPRNGDLLSKIYFTFDLPDVYSGKRSDSNKNKYNFKGLSWYLF